MTGTCAQCVGDCRFTLRQIRKLRKSRQDDKVLLAAGDETTVGELGSLDESGVGTIHLYAEEWDLMSEDVPPFDRWFRTVLYTRDSEFGEDSLTKEQYFERFVEPAGVGMTEDECTAWCEESEREEDEDEILSTKLCSAVLSYGQARVGAELTGMGSTNKRGNRDFPAADTGEWEWIWVGGFGWYGFAAVGRPISGSGAVIGFGHFNNEYEYLISKDVRYKFTERLNAREPGLIDWYEDFHVVRFSAVEAKKLAMLLEAPPPQPRWSGDPRNHIGGEYRPPCPSTDPYRKAYNECDDPACGCREYACGEGETRVWTSPDVRGCVGQPDEAVCTLRMNYSPGKGTWQMQMPRPAATEMAAQLRGLGLHDDP